MLDKIKIDGKLTLMWTEAARALICMLPMIDDLATIKNVFDSKHVRM